MLALIIGAIGPSVLPNAGNGWLPFDLNLLLEGRWFVILLMTIVLVLLMLPRSTTTPLELARELVIVIPAVLLYDVARGLAAGRESEALARATNLIHIERAVGIFWERGFQERVMQITPLTNFMNWTYLWGFWPVIISAGIWLFLLHRDEYPLYRNAFFISGAIALVIYATLPVAPPRFVEGWGFIDTVARQTTAYNLPDAPLLLNQYAAVPSLHFGWVMLVGIAIIRQANGFAKLLGLFLPALMLVSIIATGNHFILDAAAGGAVALAGLVLAFGLHSTIGERAVLQRLPVFASRLF